MTLDEAQDNFQATPNSTTASVLRNEAAEYVRDGMIGDMEFAAINEITASFVVST